MLCCNLGSILQGLPAGTGLPWHSLTLQPARLCCHGGCSLSALLSVQREFTCFPATLQQPRSTCAPGTQAKQTQGWCSGAGSVFSVSSLGLGSVTFPTESVRAVGKVENQAGSLGYSVPSRAERWTSTKFPALADPESKALDSETL